MPKTNDIERVKMLSRALLQDAANYSLLEFDEAIKAGNFRDKFRDLLDEIKRDYFDPRIGPEIENADEIYDQGIEYNIKRWEQQIRECGHIKGSQ